MARLLHIEASPRGPSSVSSAVAGTLMSSLAVHVDPLEIDRFSVFEEKLPAFDGDALDAKYAVLSGAVHDRRQRLAWRRIRALVERVDRADAVVLSTPMWNLGVPYRLKHLIDLVTQPGLSFTFSPSVGYRPLLRNRPIIAILASAGDYSEGPSFGRADLATPYLRAALAFIGFDDFQIIAVGPTVGPEVAVEEGRRRAEEAAIKTAAALGKALA